jgi:S-DNA-T family DNA segregation ATPase FtsK/SpoIIIE
MDLRAGASIRPIEGALDDLAREVGAESVSVENDPDRPYHVRFTAARRHRQFPTLPAEAAPIIDKHSQSYLGLYLGRTLDGQDHVSFVSTWPHMLVGGSTGSGKTTFVKTLLAQLARVEPGRFSVVVIDGKGEIDYFGVLTAEQFAQPFPELILGHERVVEVLDWVVAEELPRRRGLMLERARQSPSELPRPAREQYIATADRAHPSPFSPLLVVVDEFAEIMLAGGEGAKQFEQRVQQITQTGRSSLVHLVLATQRPDANVVRGAIKANLDARVALRLPTHHDSMTILGRKGAERLLGRGDLIFQAAGQAPVRLQGYST